MAIGSPEQIVEVLRRYEDVGVEEAIFARMPNRPELYQHLDEEVLGIFA